MALTMMQPPSEQRAHPSRPLANVVENTAIRGCGDGFVAVSVTVCRWPYFHADQWARLPARSFL